MPVTAVSPSRRTAAPRAHSVALSARPSGLLPRVAGRAGAQAPEAVVAGSFWRAAEDEPSPLRFDLVDVRHCDDESTIAEHASPDEEFIGPIEARAESNRLDDANPLGGGVDPEAFAAAQPVVAIPSERSRKL